MSACRIMRCAIVPNLYFSCYGVRKTHRSYHNVSLYSILTTTPKTFLLSSKARISSGAGLLRTDEANRTLGSSRVYHHPLSVFFGEVCNLVINRTEKPINALFE